MRHPHLSDLDINKLFLRLLTKMSSFMKIRFPFFSLLLAFALFACQEDQPASSGFQATPTDGQISNADLIRNPLANDGLKDTVQVAKMSFEEPNFFFGSVKEGEIVKKEFSFTNTGKVPLLIKDARSTCGCTVADWPKQPVLPGEQAIIKAEFDTKNKTGKQVKTISITANTYPSVTKIELLGEVSAE